MKVGSNGVPLLVGWNVGRGEMDAAKLKAFLRSSRQGHMPVVNGIKGSAKKPNVHACPIARRPRLGAFAPVYLLIHKIREFGP